MSSSVFLHCDEAELDLGCSLLLLRQKAWGVGGVVTTAVGHLSSEKVQQEIDTIAVAIEASTMDVERKHNLDKRVQHSTVNSVAKASRDSFVRSWRTRSRQPAAPAASAPVRPPQRLKRKRTSKFSNVVLMAVGERLELSPALCRDGGDSLREYMEAHRERLQAKKAE